MRRKFGKSSISWQKKIKKFFLLVDIGYGIFDDFRKSSKRFKFSIVNKAIVLRWMSLEGLKPGLYHNPFLLERPFEQVKLDIDQQKANVKLVGFIDYPHLDQRIVNWMLGKSKLVLIKSYFPKDMPQTEKFIIDCYKNKGPNFISLKSDKSNIWKWKK